MMMMMGLTIFIWRLNNPPHRKMAALLFSIVPQSPKLFSFLSFLCLKMFLLNLAFTFVIINPAVWALSSDEQQSALNCHNAFRSQLAKGTAANKTDLMPAGGNIIRLEYDTEIEAVAQNWANQCTMSHSSQTQRKNMGENLYMYSSTAITKIAALQQACQLWWQELQQFGIQDSLELSVSEFNKGIGHWSQMAWAKTAKVGCGIATCPNSQWKTYVVCNYSPAGNYLNQNIYQKGMPCSGCGGTQSCDANGLCSSQ